MKRYLRRFSTFSVLLLALQSIAPAYYYWTRFPFRNAPATAIVEKFDLNVLPNNTVSYFVSEQMPLTLAPNDTTTGIISQIRAAAKVWNDVDTSDLRLSYGGLITPGTPQNAPSIEVVFDEVAPGIVANGAPTLLADSNGQFVPIVQSVLTIRTDLQSRPSFGEALFGTLVHEFGHTLGLQHSLTSSAMSTGITRSTGRSRPLGDDDIAGISLLYPSRTFPSTTGSISGRVTLSGQGVNLASVVAISPNGPAVGTVTNPDGTYRISGLSPRQYLVYVHPLPPAEVGETTPANIIPPKDFNDNYIPAVTNFETLFYPGTRDPQQAFSLTVAAGASTDNVNFTVRSRVPQIHSVQTYTYPTVTPTRPPYVSAFSASPVVLALAPTGMLTSNGAVTPGLSAAILGGSSLGTRAHPYNSAYLVLDLPAGAFQIADNGPRHLIFSSNNDIYVLPSAFFVAQNAPPSITSVAPGYDINGNRVVTILGTSFTANTRVLFDGLPATITAVDPVAGRITAIPPPAPAQYVANVIAINADGQSSLLVQPDTAPTYTYDFTTGATFAGVLGGASAVTATPSALPAGVDAAIQIDVPGASFVDGQTSIGFGTSDVLVRRLWVVSPTRLLVSVTVNPYATPTAALLSITSGLQVTTQPAGFQILPANSKLFTLSSTFLNSATGQPGLQPGTIATATVNSSPIPIGSSPLVLTVNDRPVPILSINGNQILFQVPQNTAIGPITVRLDGNSDRGIPVAVSVDAPPQPQVSNVIGGTPTAN